MRGKIIGLLLAGLPFVLATGASAAGGLAYVWADKPTTAQYAPNATYAHNPTDGAIEIVRSAIGVYRIRFEGMGLADGNVQVTAYGGADKRRCKVEVWNVDGVAVRCFDLAGNPADARYTVLFSQAEGAAAYAWGHEPTEARYAATPRYAHNPTAGATEITRSSTGRYRVRFAGMRLTGGNVQISAYGADDRRCKVVGWGGDAVNLLCMDPSGKAADARFGVVFNRASGTGGGQAYVWANDSTAAGYAPSAAYAHNPSGGAIEITRRATGTYRVQFESLHLTGGNVQVTAYGSDDRFCKVESWFGTVVNVRCFESGGKPRDTRFSLLYSAAERVPAPPVVEIDPGIAPVTATLPEPDGTGSRPVVRYQNSVGRTVDFVANEMIVATDDSAALEAFLLAHGGRVLSEMDFGELAVEDYPTIYRVRVDPGATDTTGFEERWRDSAKATGTHTFSGAAGPQLLATALEAMESGTLNVALNVLLETQEFADRSTSEDAVCCTGPAGASFSNDAFTWPYMSRGSNQDIGTAEAWRVLESMGRLDTRVKIGVADGGFIPNADFPVGHSEVGAIGTPNPDPSACGGSGTPTDSCVWHGTHTVMAGMAQVGNSLGAAGPAGPVADLILVQSPVVDFFTIASYIFDSLPRALEDRPRIVNISASVELPVEACLAILAGAPICEVLHMVGRGFREAGVLVFAAAGNDGRNVDRTKEFGLCPFCFVEEAEIVIPCELDQVICVGGLSWNATGRHLNSNFGGASPDAHTVDIFGPFEVWSVASATAADIDSGSPNTATGRVRGTSFASPYVAGVAALVFAADPTLGPNEVEGILMETAHLESGDLTVPRWVNALAAVQKAVGGDTPPFLQITAPVEGASLSAGTFVDLVVEAEDLEGEVTVVWRLDGRQIGEPGPTSRRVRISGPEGSHTLEAQAFDSTGNASPIDRVTIILVNDPPVVTIVSPTGDRHCSDDDIVALADVSDPNGDLGTSVGTWYLGTIPLDSGTSITIPAGTLAAGGHSLRYVVVDGRHVVEDSVTFDVEDCPSGRLRILSPVDGDTYVPGARSTTVMFDFSYSGACREGVLANCWEWWIIPDETGEVYPRRPCLPRHQRQHNRSYHCNDRRVFFNFGTTLDAVGGYTIRLVYHSQSEGDITVEVHIEIVRSS